MIVLPTLPMAAAEVCALVSPSDGLMYGRSGAAANVLKKVAKNEAHGTRAAATETAEG